MKVTIPATIEAAKTSLAGLGSLLTAKEWERAAIVFAFTRSDTEGGDRKTTDRSVSGLSATEFAKFGITGLKSHATVRAYRKVWEKSGGDLDIKPGDTVTLPTAEWPGARTDAGWKDSEKTRNDIAREVIIANPAIVVEAAKASQAVADVVTTAVVHDHELAEEHARKAFAKRIGVPHVPKVAVPPSKPEPLDYKVTPAVTILVDALAAERDGTWVPDGITQSMLAVLLLILQDRESKREPNLFDDIRAHLATVRP